MDQLSADDIELLGGIELVRSCWYEFWEDDFCPLLHIEPDEINTYEKRKQWYKIYIDFPGIRRTGSIAVRLPDMVCLMINEHYLRNIRAANLIQSAFKNAIGNPSMEMCRNRLIREYNEIS